MFRHVVFVVLECKSVSVQQKKFCGASAVCTFEVKENSPKSNCPVSGGIYCSTHGSSKIFFSCYVDSPNTDDTDNYALIFAGTSSEEPRTSFLTPKHA